MLTDYELEKLVLLIDSGRNTFADLRHAFPDMDHCSWCIYISDAFKILPGLSGFDPDTPKVLRFLHVPEDYSPDYHFKTADGFTLTIVGENILRRVKKEHAMEQRLMRIDTITAQRYVESLKENRKANKIAFTSLIVSIIALIVAIAK